MPIYVADIRIKLPFDDCLEIVAEHESEANMIIWENLEAKLGMAEGFYRSHYIEAIAPHLSAKTKKGIAERISQLTLREPIWYDSDKDWAGDFPELRPYINVTLSGLYLCAILGAIVEELSKGGETDA